MNTLKKERVNNISGDISLKIFNHVVEIDKISLLSTGNLDQDGLTRQFLGQTRKSLTLAKFGPDKTIIDSTSLYSKKQGIYGCFQTGYLFKYIKKISKKFPDIKFSADDYRDVHQDIDAVSFLNRQEFPLRKWQSECLESIEDENEGWVVSSVGSGKTRVISEIIARKNVKTLVIAPSENIRDMLIEEIGAVVGKSRVSNKTPTMKRSFNSDKIGKKTRDINGEVLRKELSDEDRILSDKGYKFNGKNWNKPFETKDETLSKPVSDVLVLCYHSLALVPTPILDTFSMIIVDEAHSSACASIRGTLLNMPNAYFRYFFTGTKHREEYYDRELMTAAAGNNIIKEYTAKEAIKDEVILRPELETLTAPFPDYFIDKKARYKQAYDLGVVCNKNRNDVIVDSAIEHSESHNIIIFVEEVGHMNVLNSRFLDKGVTPYTIEGSQKKEVKKQQIKEIDSQAKGVITIATRAIGEGTNIPTISCVILAGNKKSFVSSIQNSGRAIRLNGPEKDKCLIINIFDKSHPTLISHSIKRDREIKKEFDIS
jgi:superfamily II DNA or RNA helicase